MNVHLPVGKIYIFDSQSRKAWVELLAVLHLGSEANLGLKLSLKLFWQNLKVILGRVKMTLGHCMAQQGPTHILKYSKNQLICKAKCTFCSSLEEL